jgi:hypothetical protein
MSSLRRLVAITALAIGLGSLGLGACGSEGGGDPTGSTCPEAGTAHTWDNFGNQFFAFYCRDCHSSTKTGDDRGGAPSDVNFDSVEEVRLHAAHIDSWAAAGTTVVNTSMPPEDPRPSEAERRQLGEWLACDAP